MLPSLDSALIQGAAGKADMKNQDTATVITESLNTAAGATLTYVLFGAQIDADAQVFVSIQNGTNTQGDPSLQLVNSRSVLGQVTVTIVNRHATLAFNGSLVLSVLIIS